VISDTLRKNVAVDLPTAASELTNRC
jgi:hypothetical protein